MELLIPEDYVSSTTERMRLYREIDTLQSSEEIKGFEDKLKDRFGAIPEPLAELLNIVSLRQLAVNLGFERIMLKNQLSPFYRSDTFAGIIAAIQQHGSTFQLKEGQNKLSIIVKNVKKVDQAISSLQLLGGLSR
jgi:transcription-repair coupling factor (superfamily II helicase)